MRFADLIPGVVIRTPPRLVTAKEMVEFASRYDTQWFHVDPVRAAEGGYERSFDQGVGCGIRELSSLVLHDVRSVAAGEDRPGICE